MLDRRRVIKALAGLFLAGSGTTGAYAYGWEPAHQRITSYALRPAGWPQGARLRIAVVADLHVGGPHMPLQRAQAIIEQANALEPDLILLLGDYVASRSRRPDDPPLPELAGVLAGAKARHGRYAVLGNHDWWHDEDAQRNRAPLPNVARALENAGIPLLENKAVRLETAAGPLWLAGLGDQMAYLRPRLGLRRGVDDLAGTLAQITDEAPVILLAHEPDIFARLPDRVALTLSGHTHGGQVRLLGWSPLVPSRYGNRYAYGHIQENGRDLVVSAGLGTSKLPIRFGIPPEIVLIELG